MLPKTGGKPNYLKLAWNYLRSPRINPMKMTESNKSIMAFNLSFLFDKTEVLKEGVANLLEWHSESLITPLKVSQYNLSDVAQAHKDIESGMTTGKLALIT